MKMQKLNQLFVATITIIMLISFGCKKKSVDDTSPSINSSITDIDGNIYHSVKIGSQVWMVENLNTTRYRDGTVIPNIEDSIVWSASTTGAYCNYNNDPTNSISYGKLYNWWAINNVKKICPEGWHVPSDSEWTELVNFLGGDSIAGDKLKEIGFTHWGFQNTSANNISGFSALPGGIRTCINSSFMFLTLATNFWTSSEENSLGVCRYMFVNNSIVSRWSYNKKYGYSIRCIKD